jgi:hypothetical protein
MGFSVKSSWTYDESNDQIFWFENLPKIKYFLVYVNRLIGPTIKINLSVQEHFCRTFATVRRTFGMTVITTYMGLLFENQT